MEETSIQLTLSEEEIKNLEKAVCWKIEDKEDLYQAVIMAIKGYSETHKPRTMGYARFNKED